MEVPQWADALRIFIDGVETGLNPYSNGSTTMGKDYQNIRGKMGTS